MSRTYLTMAMATSADKQFGIRVELPLNDPMSAPHLLGAQWSGTRWFDTEAARDIALEKMQKQPAYYRHGDTPTVQLTKVSAS